MKVLRVVSLASRTGRYGGPFDSARAQAALLREAGHRVRVIAGAFPGDEPVESSGLQTFPVRHVAGLKTFVDVAGMSMFSALWHAVRGADIVHISMAREPIPVVSAILAIITRTPYVAQPHGMLTTARRGPAHRLLDALVMRPLMAKAARIIALTDAERRELAEWSGVSGRADVVGNPPPRGLPEGDEPGDEADVFTDALFAARLHPRKRVLDFARAAEQAQKNGWDERYAVLGPDEGDLGSLREIEERTASLTYAGATDNVGVLQNLKRSRVFVLPSLNEPWGNVLVAALSYGKPVVVTRSSALASAISAHGAGRVVPDGDPKAIAEAVHELLHQDRYPEFSARARRFAASELSAAGVKSALLEVYDSALRAGSAGRSQRRRVGNATGRLATLRTSIRRLVLTNFGKSLLTVAVARTVVRPDRTIRILRKWQADAKALPLQRSAHFLDYLEIHHAMAAHVGRFPDLVDPMDFNDKIQWLKLFDQREQTIQLADKVAVREWVAERIGAEYLIPVLQVADRPRDLDLGSLGTAPFVVKASHDSGSAQIVRQTDDISWRRVTKRLDAALRRRYGTWNAEWPYRYVRRRVLVEKYIGAGEVLPVDYKFNCVNGAITLARIFWDREQGAKVSTVLEDGTPVDIQMNPSYEYQGAFDLPANWRELCALARKLSEGIPFVRVDLYSTGDRIYFGEMTFLPQGGLYKGGDQRALGELTPIDVSRYEEPVVGRLPVA